MSLKICDCGGMNPAIALSETNNPASNAKKEMGFKLMDFMT
jgi:hypothetical protein